MPRNLAQRTYDVFVSEDDRWLIDSHHEVRSAAMDRAEQLLEQKRFEGVRVVAESVRTGSEEVLFEERFDVGDKPVKIVPIDHAPVCVDIGDFYRFPARQAAGRLLRELLDRTGRTALEFGFDYGALRMLERNDTLFPAAMQRIGTIQAKQTGDKPAARIDALYRAFERIKENARVAGDDRVRQTVLESGGLALLADRADGDEDARRIYVLGGIALALGALGDWSDKMALVIDLAAAAPDDLVVAYLDEVAAEILDNNAAVSELFGGFGDTMSACRALVQVTQGRCRIQNPRTCLADFNDLMAARPMRLTQSVLLGRVARMLDSIRPLTREGAAAERDAFTGLVREMTGDAGLVGGPRMAGAVTARARMVYADPDDLSVQDGLDKVLALLPNRAVRLGFLLEALASPLGRSHEQVVLDVLSRLVQQLTSLSSLIPRDTPEARKAAVLADLKARIVTDALPEKWRDLFARTLERLAARGDEPLAEDGGGGMTYRLEEAGVNDTGASKKNVERREAAAGEVLFEEGDDGGEAYLILDGEVQVYRKVGNQEVVLATLGRGDILGEMSLIDNQPRMASARTVGNAKLTVIDRADLAARLGRLGDSDKVLRRLIDVFVDRLRGQARLHE